MSTLIRRPSTTITCSLTNDDSVRMALEVVMFDRLAKSSRDMYMLSVKAIIVDKHDKCLC